MKGKYGRTNLCYRSDSVLMTEVWYCLYIVTFSAVCYWASLINSYHKIIKLENLEDSMHEVLKMIK